MPQRSGPVLLYAALVTVVLAAAGVGGYVYRHDPVRDTLLVEVAATPAPAPTSISGSISRIEGATYTLVTPTGREVTLTLPAGTPVEALQRLIEPPEEGTAVNVGVEDTSFGQVLTGIVAVEGSAAVAGAAR